MVARRVLWWWWAGLVVLADPGRLRAQDAVVDGDCPEAEAPVVQASRKLAGGPNEPAGFVPVSRREFMKRVEAEWTDRGDRGFRIVEDPTAPASAPFIGRAFYPRGFQGGRGPILTEVGVPAEHRGLYLSFWMRLSPEWTGHASGVNKIFHLWIADHNRVYLSAHGRGSGPYVPQVNLQGIPGPQIARDLNPIRSGRIKIRRGEWVHWELVFWANHPGERDARVEWWVNGEFAGRESGFALVRPREKGFWERVTWNPTWGGMGGAVPAPMYQDMDEIYVSAGG